MKKLLVLAMVFASTNAMAQKIDWFASADMVGVQNSEEDYAQDIHMREFELALHSVIDQTWSAGLSFVYAKDANAKEETTELHEAYIQSSKIFPGHTLKLGKFFLGFGKLGTIHRHEWRFTDAPLFYSKFFGNEGVVDMGGEFTYRLGTSQNIQMTLGVTKGAEFAHNHGDEEASTSNEPTNAQWPTHYARVFGFNEFSTLSGLEYGLSYVGRKDAEKTASHYAGLDFTYKKRAGKQIDLLIQGEYWQRTYRADKADEFTDNGFYLLVEKGLNQHHSLGLRYDEFTPDKDTPEAAEHNHKEIEVEDKYTASSLIYTYSNSEFMKTRLSATYENGVVVDEEETNNTKVMAQLLFNIGVHPVHLF